jgi:hypothetical protein
VLESSAGLTPAFVSLSGRLNSECSQQDGADENEHSADRQHFELQGKGHSITSPVDASRLAEGNQCSKQVICRRRKIRVNRHALRA